MDGAMPLWLGVELAPMLDTWFCHFWKSGCPGLLLFFRALTEIELESRSGDTDFLACWWEEDEIPLFLLLGDGVNSETVPELGHWRTGLCSQLVLPGLHSFTDILWWLFPVEKIRCIISLIRQWDVLKMQILHFTSSFGRAWWETIDTTRARW